MDLPPVLTVACPFFCNVHHCQIQHFEQTVIAWEYGFGFRDFSQLPVKSFDRIGRINQAPDSLRILEIGRKIYPVIFP